MHVRSLVIPAVFAAVLPALAAAQDQKPAPVPPALASAKSIFVSNAGADGGLFPHPFSGTTARGYDRVFDDLRQWGRYTLAIGPAEADLVLEVRIAAPMGPSNADKSKGAPDPLPTVLLTVYDQPTHYILWSVARSVDVAYLQKTHDRNLDDAIDGAVQDLKLVISPQPRP